MKIFGYNSSWYRNAFCAYKYALGQGEMLVGEIESIITLGGLGGILILIINKYTNWLAPWWILVILVICLKIIKVFIGRLDKRYFKLGQAMSEYTSRKKINVWEAEKMEILKNIEKKVSPETYHKEPKTYIEKSKDEDEN